DLRHGAREERRVDLQIEAHVLAAEHGALERSAERLALAVVERLRGGHLDLDDAVISVHFLPVGLDGLAEEREAPLLHEGAEEVAREFREGHGLADGLEQLALPLLRGRRAVEEVLPKPVELDADRLLEPLLDGDARECAAVASGCRGNVHGIPWLVAT